MCLSAALTAVGLSLLAVNTTHGRCAALSCSAVATCTGFRRNDGSTISGQPSSSSSGSPSSALLLAAAALAVALAAVAAEGGDWPRWRGPDCSNVSAETGAPPERGFLNFRRNLVNIQAIAKAHGAEVMFVTPEHQETADYIEGKYG